MAELIKRSQKGDLKTFESLVTMYQGRVFGLCVKLTGNRDDAEDLAQEVFIKAFNSLKGFRLEADFGTWLHRIAVNMWLNIKKKNSRATIVSLDEPISTSNGEITREVADGDSSRDPLASLEEVEFRGHVRQALGRLSQEHQAVLVLRDMEGYSYEEIARITDSSLGTVKSRINRARQTLRNIMTEEFRIQNPESRIGK
ncbi:MAG: RNA polymerase subunit sigma-24 [Peptococcaceae bacterium BICA1-7]|nr:MAG: RNA polymerase subunit sigma-24 [Peptococcaceae bacterium BICA1-7]